MIQQQTKLKVTDNSGAKEIKCIKVLGGFKRKHAILGDLVVVSVTKLRNKSKRTSKVKKGEVFKALILQTIRKTHRKDGSYFCYNQNIACLINKQGKPIATRILKPISKKLRKGKFMKFISIAVGFI
uniref:Ribosomal protein L14 n=1 Tax=Trieres regia TaxID=1335017 RepID=A0A7T4WR31_9STRA|nr:ribosomal protein L14 [Odontella regia]QQD79313.1 ribosomal protein L14 [Odontella regia]